MLTASLFLLGFHGSLLAIAYLNYELPCERPLAGFLGAAGIVGCFGTFVFLTLERCRSRDEALLLPTEALPPPAGSHKLLVLLGLFAALVRVRPRPRRLVACQQGCMGQRRLLAYAGRACRGPRFRSRAHTTHAVRASCMCRASCDPACATSHGTTYV